MKIRVYDKTVSACRWAISVFFLCVGLAPFVLAPLVRSMMFHATPHFGYEVLSGVMIVAVEMITGLVLYGLYHLFCWIVDTKIIGNWWGWVTTQDFEKEFIDKI